MDAFALVRDSKQASPDGMQKNMECRCGATAGNHNVWDGVTPPKFLLPPNQACHPPPAPPNLPLCPLPSSAATERVLYPPPDCYNAGRPRWQGSRHSKTRRVRPAGLQSHPKY